MIAQPIAPPIANDASAAAAIARFLRSRGVRRIFALCGGHIMPIWMRVDAEGIAIVDVRDERSAVLMAQAHAEMTGELGVALITAGPGVTNGMTGIANAHVSRTPLLILSGTPPQAQENRGALQDMVHVDLVRSLTRYARTVRDPALVLQELDEAVSRAFGEGGDPGPVYLDFPTDTLRAPVPPVVALPERFEARKPSLVYPDPVDVARAVEILWSAKKPLVISGRGARGGAPQLRALLDRLGAAYLDTGESRGLVPDDHPSVVSAMRGAVMTQADVVLTVGRRLDFQLAYGSPAVFGEARFVRIADAPSEFRDNRRGDASIFASAGPALDAILTAAGDRAPATDRSWTAGLRAGHEKRANGLLEQMRAAPQGKDGRMHPNRLLAELRDGLPEDTVVIADGGDFLSFARVGLPASTYLDPGSLGCLGVGMPFGIATSLALPDRTVAVVTGDGAFGFTSIELDTAARHKAPLLIVIANNAAWQIEVRDQDETYGRNIGTKLQDVDYAAIARAYGLHAQRVENAEDLPAAIATALANRPALLDVTVTTDAVSSDGKTGLAWVPDLQPLAAWDDAERKWRAGPA